MRRIGVLLPAAADDPEDQARVGGVPARRCSNWAGPIGRNVRIDNRWAAANADDIRRHAAELVALAPDVILATGSLDRGAVAAGDPHRADRVRAVVADPVGAGFVESLARPGGNATGFMHFEYSMSGKWLELLKQIAPRRDASGGPSGSRQPSGIGQFGAIQAVAPSLGVEVSPVNVRDAGEIERAVAAFARSPNGGLIVTASASATRSSRTDHHAGGPAQAARGLLRSLLRRRRRPDLLRA